MLWLLAETTRLWIPVEMLETASSQHCRESGLKVEELHARTHAHHIRSVDYHSLCKAVVCFLKVWRK